MNANVATRNRPGTRGSMSVVALMVCAVSTMGLLGMVSLMQARVAQVDSQEEACLRRVREMNGRQLAKEFAFRRVWTSTAGTAETVELPGNWGRIDVPAWSESAFGTMATATVFNPVGPDPRGLPYQVALDIAVANRIDPTTGAWVTGATARTVSTRIQGRSPATAGFLLDARSQNETRTVSGDLTVHGKALIWQPGASDNVFSFRAEQLHGYSDSLVKANVQVRGTSGTDFLAPRNLPGLTFPNWFAEAGSESAPGAYPAIFADDWAPFEDNTIIRSLTWRAVEQGGGILDAGTEYEQDGIVSDGLGTVVVDLNNLGLPSLVLDNYVNLVINGQQSAAQMMAVENLVPVILVLRSGTGASIQFIGSNRRPLIIAFQSNEAPPVTLQFEALSDHRMFLLADRQPLALGSPGQVTLRGGIATDHDLAVTAGSFHLYPETANPGYFDHLLWRSFWVETYQRP